MSTEIAKAVLLDIDQNSDNGKFDRASKASLFSLDAKQFKATTNGFSIQAHKNQLGLYREVENKEPRLVSGPIEVLGLAREQQSTGWAALLEFQNHDKELVRWLMPLSMLSDTNEIIRQLRDRGLFVVAGPMAKEDLSKYLSSTNGKRYSIADNTGWFNDSFVLPDGAIGDDSIILRTPANPLIFAGTIESWKDNIGKYCIGNSRPCFSVCIALASPLLKLMGMEGGGFHFVGKSSDGKTTCVRVGSSAFGLSVNSWRTTDNALEGMLAASSDIGIVLDDIGTVSPHCVGDMLYMLANGKGKARANRLGSVRQLIEWRLLTQSTGEVTPQARLSSIGRTIEAGQELRLPNIESDAGIGYGSFENLHSFENPKELADHLNKAVKGNAGHVGHEYLTLVQKGLEHIPALFDEFKLKFRRSTRIGNSVDPQVLRVMDRFALCAYAGEFASRYELTGWDEEEALRASVSCFHSWLSNWAPAGSREDQRALEQVKSFLQRHADRFQNPADDSRVINNRAGYRDSENFYVFNGVFESEVCVGIRKNTALNILEKSNYLIRDTDGKRQKRKSFNGQRERLYAIPKSILSAECVE